MVYLLSTLYNLGLGVLVLRTLGGWFYHTLPTCTPVWMCDWVEMTWTGMPCADCSVQSMPGAFCLPLLLLLLGSRLTCQPSAGLLLWLAPFGVVMTVRRAAGHRVTGRAARLACYPSPGGLHAVLHRHFFPSTVTKCLHQPTDIKPESAR